MFLLHTLLVEIVATTNAALRSTTRPSSRLAIGGASGFLLLGVLVSAYGPLIPALRAEFGLSATDASLLLSAHFTGAVAGVLAAGAVARYIDIRTRFFTEVGFIVAGTAVLVSAPALPPILLGALLIGLGFGGMDLDLFVFFTAAYGERSATGLNLLQAGYGLGAIAGPLIVAVVHANRMAIGLIYLVLALSLIPLLNGAKLAKPSLKTPTALTAGRYRLVIALFMLFYLVYVAAETEVGSWAATYLIEAVGMSAIIASGSTAAFWATFTIGRLVAASLSLRVPAGKLLPTTLFLATISIALAFWPPAAAIGFILTGLFLAPVFPTGISWLAQTLPSGASTALVIAGSSFGPVLISPLVGQAHDRLGPTAVVIVLIIVTALTLFLALAIRRSSQQPAH